MWNTKKLGPGLPIDVNAVIESLENTSPEACWHAPITLAVMDEWVGLQMAPPRICQLDFDFYDVLDMKEARHTVGFRMWSRRHGNTESRVYVGTVPVNEDGFPTSSKRTPLYTIDVTGLASAEAGTADARDKQTLSPLFAFTPHLSALPFRVIAGLEALLTSDDPTHHAAQHVIVDLATDTPTLTCQQVSEERRAA